MRRSWALLGAALLLSACGKRDTGALPPLGQVVLYIDTDAPVPAPPGETLAADEPTPLFDRLRVELFAPGASEPCVGCSREFELDRARLRDAQVSLGITPEPGQSGYIARLRLFRGVGLEDGEPPALSTIESNVLLPVVSSEGLVEATARLLVDSLGAPRGSLEAPVEPEPGKPTPSLVGTWPGARRVPCPSAPRQDEACVPGGAFWMGNPALQLSEDGSDTRKTRLVGLSPFFIRLHETSVAELRASGLARLDDAGHALEPLEGARANRLRLDQGLPALTVNDLQYFCNYAPSAGPDDEAFEEQALGCVSWDMARDFCAASGSELPTQAQFEYVASALSSQSFVWGNELEDLRCADAVWDRCGIGAFYDGVSGACRPEGQAGSPSKPGTGRLDRLRLGEREVVDLAANLAEWMLDDWNRPSEPCWKNQSLLQDPRCQGQSEDGDLRTVKGGNWAGSLVAAADGAGRPPAKHAPGVGFRCARPAN